MPGIVCTADSKTRGRYWAAIAPCICGAACAAPARTHARLRPGTTIGVSLAASSALSGPSRDGDEGGSTHPHLTGSLQYALALGGGHRLALQAKIPLYWPAASLDLYYQLPERQSYVAGFGIDVGDICQSGYGVVSTPIGDRGSLTATLQGSRCSLDQSQGTPVLYPQLSLGDGRLSLFVGYARFFRGGLDFSITDDENGSYDGIDPRFDLFSGGVSARF